MINPGAIKVKFDKKVFNEIYIPTYKCKDRYLFLYGGAGSGKSEWAAQKILRRMLTETPHRFLLARKVAATIRNSQYALFKDLVARWKMQDLFEFTDLKITCVNGNEIISTGLDSAEKLKSITSISGIWAEELTEFSRDDMLQLNMRMRGHRRNYKQFIATFNPTDMEHWIRRTYFPEGNTESDLYRFEIPDPRHEFNPLFGTAFRTTFRDNKFLDDDDRAVMTALEAQNMNHYRIYALGLWGTKQEGQIYTKYQVVDSMPDGLSYEFYGLDFGFTNPTALVHVGIKDAQVYIRQLIYQSNLTNPELIAQLKELIPKRSIEIFADSASPDKIAEIHAAGFNISPANKDVKHGIGIVQNLMLNITSDSSAILKEIVSYVLKRDKNDKAIDEPVKFNDHCMDAIRYAIYTAWLKYGTRVFGGKEAKKSTKPRRERKSRASAYDGY